MKFLLPPTYERSGWPLFGGTAGRQMQRPVTRRCANTTFYEKGSCGVAKANRFCVASVPAISSNIGHSICGGYIAHVVSEKVNCENCVSVCSKPASNQPLLQLTRHQDRGGLLYPSDQLLFVLDTLRDFADCALKDNPTLAVPLSTLTKYTIPALFASRLLKCHSDGSYDHRMRLMNIICIYFLRPLLSNYAFNVTDQQDACKYLARKPFSRKYVRI
ncbi:hypothetical protein HPB51_016634 [Rhipicephalus microplus]|uniref:Uncharacterized protein n=1 Tax=Rhipicephalus microplus TaxID=6941 RepID=A0A9J6EHJ8_RHIMP|nr:hypothetical protein HPB51_016634 [Rhipicephalus microplus]